MEGNIPSNNSDVYKLDIDIKDALGSIATLINEVDKVKKAINKISANSLTVNVELKGKNAENAINKLDTNISQQLTSLKNEIAQSYNDIAKTAANSIEQLRQNPSVVSSMKQFGSDLGKVLSDATEKGLTASANKMSTIYKQKESPFATAMNSYFKLNTESLKETFNEFKTYFNGTHRDEKGNLDSFSRPFEELNKTLGGPGGTEYHIRQVTDAMKELVNVFAGKKGSSGLSPRQQVLFGSLFGGAGFGTGGIGLGGLTLSAEDEVAAKRITSNYTKAQLQDLYGLSEGQKEALVKANQDIVKARQEVAAQMKKESEAVIKRNEKEAKRAEREEELADKKAQAIVESRKEKFARLLGRRETFIQNVDKAIEMFGGRPSNSSYKQQKLFDEYARSLTRLAGIRQAAAANKFLSPTSVYSALAQQNAAAVKYNTYNLTKQMGLDKYKKETQDVTSKLGRLGTAFQKFSSLVASANSIFNTLRGIATTVTKSLTNLAYQLLPRLVYKIRSLLSSSLESYKSLETAMIGFENFFGAENVSTLVKKIKAEAVKAPGVDAASLADEIREIAPLSNGNSELALQATLGMLKTIQYGGGSNSEMAYVIKNIRDVMAKGKATQIDLNQFNRAMPALVKALEAIGRSDMISKNGTLKITKDNAGTLLEVFAELNTSENSIVKDIFTQTNNTITGQIQQLQEQLTTDWNTLMEETGVYPMLKSLLKFANQGQYLTHFLGKFRTFLSDIMDWLSTHQFEIINAFEQLGNAIKILLDGVKDAWESIKQGFGADFDAFGVIKRIAGYLRDFISGLGSGLSQVIRFVESLSEKLRAMGLENWITTFGWLGSAMGSLVSKLGSTVADVLGITSRLLLMNQNLTNMFRTAKLNQMTAEFGAIPASILSTSPSSDVQGGMSSLARFLTDPVAQAIEDQKTAMLKETGDMREKLQTIANAVTTLSKQVAEENTFSLTPLKQSAEYTKLYGENVPVATAGYTGPFSKTFGQRIVYVNNDPETNRPEIKVLNKKTGEWTNQTIYSSTGKELTGAARNNPTYVSKVFAQQASAIDKSNKKWNAITNVMGKAVTAVGKFTAISAIGTMASSLVESLNIFGDATETVSQVLNTASTTIAGAMAGSTFGKTGGIIGALAGLGIGLVQLTNTIAAKEKELREKNVNESLTEAQQNMYDQVVDFITNSNIPHNFTSTAGKHALDDMLAYIKATPASSLTAEGAIKAYANALAFNKTQEALEDFINGDIKNYAGGRTLDFSADENADETLKTLLRLINYYQLAENNVDTYDNTTNTYGLSGQELLESVFPDGITADEVKKLEELEKQTTSNLQTTIGDVTQDVIDSDKIGNNYLKNIDNNVEKLWKQYAINAETGKSKGELSAETTTSLYGEAAGNSQSDYETYGSSLANKFIAENLASSPSEIATTLSNEIDRLSSINQDGKYDKTIAYLKTLLDKGFSDWDWKAMGEKYGDSVLRQWQLYWEDLMEKYSKLPGGNKDLLWKIWNAGGGPIGQGRGVDTIPAFLTRGEYVVKPSAVKKIGLSTLQAINHGDLTPFLRNIATGMAANLTNNYSSTTSNFSARSTNNTNNTFNIKNYGTASRLNTYYSLANRLG